MEEIPSIYRTRELSFEPETLSKLRYLNWKAGKQNYDLRERFSSIVNESLRDFFDIQFPKLKIERFVDHKAEADKIRSQRKKESQAKEAEDKRLLRGAKLRIVKNEIEKIKEEEKKAGKKIELPDSIGRILGNNYKI